MKDQAETVALLQAEVDRLRSRLASTGDDPTWDDLVEDAMVGVYRISADGRFVKLNQAVARILGYDDIDHLIAEAGNITGLYVDPRQRDRILKDVDRRGGVDGQEAEFYRRSGETVWVRFSTRRRVVDGEVQYEGFWVDITAEKEARDKLLRSEQRFRDMIELLPVGVVIFGGNLDCQYVNQQFEGMYGYTAEQIGDLDQWVRMIHADDEQLCGIRREIEAWLKSDRTAVRAGREKFTNWSGQVRDIIFRAVSLNDGRILYIIEDVTDYLQAEAEAKIQKSRFDLALEAGDLCMWDWDSLNNKLDLSPRFCDMLQCGRDDRPASLEYLSQRLHPDELESFTDAVQRHLSGKTERFEEEFRFRSKSGQWRWMISRGRVIDRTPEGRPKRAMGVLTDITQRHRAEKELREAQRAREEADRRTLNLLRSAAANVAHQIGGFLNKLVFALAIIRAEKLQPEAMETLDAVERGGIALDAFVRRFITLTRSPKPDYQPVDLDKVISRALSDCAEALKAARVEIEIISSGPHGLRADKSILAVVMRNLIMAAVDALVKQAAAGRRLRLSVEPGEDDGVRLELTSAGVGPTKAVGPGRTGVKNQIDAVGLELPTAQYLIAVHGGEVNFRPQPGRPIRFVLDLPLIPKNSLGKATG